MLVVPYDHSPTADDWEMLELNQEYLIQNLLAQVNTITLDRPFPFFVRGNRLLLCATGASAAATRVGFALLANNSEVAVAPKVRRATALNATSAAAAVTSQVTHVDVASWCHFKVMFLHSFMSTSAFSKRLACAT